MNMQQIINNHNEIQSPIIKNYTHFQTPSTSNISNYQIQCQPDIPEFNIDINNQPKQIQNLTRIMSGISIQGKQNDQHATDRFIPLRKKSSFNGKNFDLIHQIENVGPRKGQEIKQKNKMTLNEMYKMVLLQQSAEKILCFNDKNNRLNTSNSFFNSLQQKQTTSLLHHKKLQQKCMGITRKIQKLPYKVLDAPNLIDDFYLNLLEWSSKNILSVALESSLYFWNGNNNHVMRFCQQSPNLITSLNWNSSGSHLAIGNNLGNIEIWDAIRATKIQELSGHTSRVSSIAWSQHHLIASGSRDKSINLRDYRINSASSTIQTYEGHTQEVCGLKWSIDGSLLASGGNDNKIMVWNNHSNVPISKFNQHSAAVKGLAWNPHNHGVLVSGGGSADKTIKFWNTLDSTLLDSIDTGSQVCNLAFSSREKQFISTHGYSNNEIIIWKYPTLEKISTLTGHSSRVLYLATNPTQQTIVTGAGDETLRFWKICTAEKKQYKHINSFSSMELR